MDYRKQKQRHHSQRLTLAILALVLLSAPVFVRAYVEPSGPPPQSSPPSEFLNGSTAEQRKTGSFLIGEKNGVVPNCTNSDATGCSKICINSDLNKGVNDTNNCISAWGDLTSFVGGPFVRLLSSSQLGLLDQGFVNIRAQPEYNQLITLITEANGGAAAEGLRAVSTTTSSYAAQFAGRVAIRKTSSLTEICLNGTCLSDWASAGVSLPADAVKLQSPTYYTTQTGNIGLSGPLVVGSLVVGTPLAQTDTIYTYGDGICSPQNGETPLNASKDCP